MELEFGGGDWFDKINSQGIKAIEILAGFMGFEQAWFEHIVMDRMQYPEQEACKCRILGGERQEECPAWKAVERYKNAAQALEHAKRDLESANKDLDAFR
jgi:hypothetical protein